MDQLFSGNAATLVIYLVAFGLLVFLLAKGTERILKKRATKQCGSCKGRVPKTTTTCVHCGAVF